MDQQIIQKRFTTLSILQFSFSNNYCKLYALDCEWPLSLGPDMVEREGGIYTSCSDTMVFSDCNEL